ncbi:uncharacterized protein FIBRA_05948 [Fibroporia radiculosa]|uniref:ZZ-type domain-containing protein n=1 Tax=Fibroporia radiculosa TaxID=599839 RepID=J4GRX0_9APHY|nr:uncharacterized protein FIBRA_05948 [Fibroporia radiculosa]CCM03800.1 predicted protein [Fibroporia radiculosa]
MFTVKATYRNETRKFTFSDTFPSFEQLYLQLYRIFPISHSFYLSKLLFSPNSPSHSQRILIGMEAHNAEEYESHVAPYRGRSWPGALLKFSVYDETPHKSPGTSSSQRTSMMSVDSDLPSIIASEGTSQSSATIVDWTAAGIRKRRTDDRRFIIERLRERTSNRSNVSVHDIQEPLPRRSLSRSPLRLTPSPPITPQSSSRPLPRRPSYDGDASSSTTGAKTTRPSLFELLNQEPSVSPSNPTADESSRPSLFDLLTQESSKSGHCDSWTFGRPTQVGNSSQEQRHSILTAFPPPPPVGSTNWLNSWPPVYVPPPSILYPSVPSSQPEPPSVVEEPSWAATLSPRFTDIAAQPQAVRGDIRAQCSTAEQQCPERAASPMSQVSASSIETRQQTADHCCSISQGKAEVMTLIERFMDNLDRTMKTAFGDDWAFEFAPAVPSVHCARTDTSQSCALGKRNDSRSHPSDPVVIRVPSPTPEHFPSFPQFMPPSPHMSPPFVGPLSLPQCYIPPVPLTPPPLPPAQCYMSPVPPTPSLVPPTWPVPPETSHLRPLPSKCLNCPDFDTCATCFQITPEQHPGHSFIKINNPEALVIRNGEGNTVLHDATCDVCGRRIVGVRYKCMHASCPDFDLCHNCEAMPFPVHPPAHPLLKMKSPDTIIPIIQKPIMNQCELAESFLDECRASSPPILPSDIQQVDVNRSPCLAFGTAPALAERFPSLPSDQCLEVDGELPISLLKSVTIPDSALLGPMDAVLNASPIHADAAPLAPTAPLTAEKPETSPVGIPASIFEDRSIDLDQGCNGKYVHPEAEVWSGGLTTPSEIPASTAPSTSIPRLGPVNNDWLELWPELTSMLKHLLTPPTPNAGASVPSVIQGQTMPGGMVVEEPKLVEEVQPESAAESKAAVEESPLVGEPLLCRPLGPRISDLSRKLNAVSVRRESSPEHAPYAHIDTAVKPETARQPPFRSISEPQPLYASFLSDNNIPDGQIFPPGAEFVKSWRMMNQGKSDWPETTELVFVAGDRMAPHNDAPRKIKVGSVKAGKEVEIAAGEMKAPDIPGKYVSYWRLSDGAGHQFGHSVWVDITVAEVTRALSVLSTEDTSLASSSVIMPRSMENISAPAEAIPRCATTVDSAPTLPSSPPSEDGSLDSSMSLVDVPSSPISDDDEDAYADSRSRFVSPNNHAQEVEYVMLYDSSSSEDD